MDLDLFVCLFWEELYSSQGFFPGGWLSSNLPAILETGLIPGSGRSLGGRHGNPLQYSCLENPMNQGTWWAMIHRVAKSQT